MCGDPLGFAKSTPLAGAVPKAELSSLLPNFFSKEILDELESKWASKKHHFQATIRHNKRC
jgi:hypothetical protein